VHSSERKWNIASTGARLSRGRRSQNRYTERRMWTETFVKDLWETMLTLGVLWSGKTLLAPMVEQQA
jgi:hypothetical protein